MPDVTPPPYSEIRASLDRLHLRMAAALREAGRPADAVRLIAVSKTHPAAAVEAALRAGQLHFGENRVQEAAAKFPDLRAQWPDLVLHAIGGLQTNKAEDAVRLADYIHVLDRVKLADAVARAADKLGRLPKLLVQVNTGREAQKGGVLPEEADGFIEFCKGRFGAALVGLMCIPPAQGDPRADFRMLREMGVRHGLAELSMGMSADFEVAVAEGASFVRVGTAVFGGR